VKELSSRWVVAALLAPVLLILGLVIVGGNDSASAKPVASGKALVAVSFVSSFAKSASVTGYQSVNLNVVSVRLNPSKNPTVADSDGGWVAISVPQGIAKSAGLSTVSTGNNFGGNSGSGNSVTVGEGRAEIQIDLFALQNIAQIFNAAAVPAKTYRQVELVMDAGTPGNMVPVCGQTAPSGEGCISYRAQVMPTPAAGTPLTIRTSLNATNPNGGLDLSKGTNVVTPLVIDIDPGLGPPPTASNQAVLVTPTICVANTSFPTCQTSPALPQLGTVTGTIKTTASKGFSNKGPQAVTALLAGTDNIILSQGLPNSCNGKTTCTFTMNLPAAAVGGGTNYDFVFSQKTSTFAVLSNINVVGGMATSITLPTVATKPTNSFAGKVVDFCSTTGVQAATLDLLLPDPSAPIHDCTANPPIGCVVVASGSSDDAGAFPMPANGKNPPAFMFVPLPDPSTPYELIATAAGYDRTPIQVTTAGSSFKCSPSNKGCSINLNHGFLKGTVALDTGDNGPAAVMVAAEDHGTNNIENSTLVTILPGVNFANYTMNVPDSSNIGPGNSPVGALDLFASTQDLFNGAPQKFTGHTFAVQSDVTAPAPPTSTCNTISAGTDLTGMTCVGHGSVRGTVTDPGSNDTVVLSKGDVQIEAAPVGPFASANAANYAICAPADPEPYTLQHYEQATPTPRPVGNPVSVTLVPPTIVPTPVPSPGITPVPCPGICNIVPGTPNNGCLICNSTSLNF
jgi:hypothetical protein